MSDNRNIPGYFDTINKPWGKLFYELAWHNIECENKMILDFGSGFGVTANHFAQHNTVVAVEPDSDMLRYRFSDNEYEQIIGGIEELKKMPSCSFDVIICHNVFEYLENRREVLCEFSRLLNQDGFISLIKHNKAGKIMQKAVFEYNIDEALKLLDNENIESANFGTIHEYDTCDLKKYCEGMFDIEKIYGIRMFFALQRNEIKGEEKWFSDMFNIECRVEKIPEFRDIAFFHHIILNCVGNKREI